MHNKLIKTDFSKIKEEKTQYRMIVSVIEECNLLSLYRKRLSASPLKQL